MRFTSIDPWKSVLVLSIATSLSACQSTGPTVADSEDPQTVKIVAKPAPPLTPETQSRYKYALSLIRSGQTNKAISTLEQLSRRQPKLAGPHTNLGILYLKKAKLAKAAGALEKAVEMNPANASAQNHLGIVYRKQGKFKEALVAYRNALQVDPSYATAHLNIGILYDLYLGQLSQALNHYQKYQSLTGKSDKQVTKWIVDLERRVSKSNTGGDKG